ncbi:nucleoside recognition membrane protein YjiH [Peribacillus frigoritolerans]
MTMSILPSILSVGLISLVLAEYTSVFKYLFYPFSWALQIPEPFLAAKASAIGIAEMFLPALLVVGAPLVTKFIIAVVSVSSILFFSAAIPCILSTENPDQHYEVDCYLVCTDTHHVNYYATHRNIAALVQINES